MVVGIFGEYMLNGLVHAPFDEVQDVPVNGFGQLGLGIVHLFPDIQAEEEAFQDISVEF